MSRTGRPPVDPRIRFWRFVQKTPTCWNWTGKLSTGYGQFFVRNKNGKPGLMYAHRFSYEMVNGPIEHKLTLDHLCRNRRCVNPAHLEAVTQRVNVHRGEGLAAANVKKTVCANGHALVGDNVRYTKAKERTCVTCQRAATRRWYFTHSGRAVPQCPDARRREWRNRIGSK